MFGKYPLTFRLLVFVITPLLGCFIAAWMYFRSSLPSSDHAPFATRVGAEVALSRDANGVAYIRAASDHDAFFAIGYAHAQDRLWQLELQRRIAQGRLSEIFGRNALRQDVWMRTLGLYPAAESSWKALDPEARASLSAYTAGINAYLARKPVLPVEFKIFGIEPQPWREVDSLAWSKVFALNLAGNMSNEVANWVTTQYLTPAQLADLGMPTAPQQLVATAHDAPHGMIRLQQEIEDRLRIGGRHVGSNAWVVAGSRMRDGHAALANDTHLGLQIPSLWYVASIKGDRLDVSGMTLVGLPVVVFGRNRHIAWGGTSMMADVQDLYLEQVNPKDPLEYARGAEWKHFQTRTESIGVKADFPAALRGRVAPVTIQVRSTDVGPIVSDIVGAVDQPVALKWTALDSGDTSYEAFLRANYATDWNSFRSAFEPYVAPALNLVYIDAENNIGALGVGRVPIRNSGDGRMPVPAWLGEYGWKGYVPFAEWPQQFNPPTGMIVTANDGPAGPTGAHFISADWAPPHRAARIRELLQSGKALSLDDFQRVQADTTDKGALELLVHLRQTKLPDAKQRRAQAYLARWNGRMDVDSVGATIFYVWSRHLREELFRKAILGDWNRPLQNEELDHVATNASYAQLLRALTSSSANWCKGAAPNRCSDVVQRSLSDALSELEKLRGSDMEKWRWGEVHHTVYPHLGFSDSGVLAAIFERKIGNGGSPDTINVASAQYRESEGYEQSFGPGFRQLIQFDGAVKHRYMNSTGQSGNVLSPHYDDMVRPFRDTRYFELATEPHGVGKDTRLIPEHR